MKAAITDDAPQTRASGAAEIRPAYLEALTLVERLHRALLDVIKDELDRRDEREDRKSTRLNSSH